MEFPSCEHRNLLNDVKTGLLSCMKCGYEMTQSDFNAWLGLHAPAELLHDTADEGYDQEGWEMTND